MIYNGDKKGTLYKGDAHPAEMYKGGNKAQGWKIENASGERMTFNNTYNADFDKLTAYGMSEQKRYSGYQLHPYITVGRSYSDRGMRGEVTLDGVHVTGTPSVAYASCVQSYVLNKNVDFVAGDRLYVSGKTEIGDLQIYTQAIPYRADGTRVAYWIPSNKQPIINNVIPDDVEKITINVQGGAIIGTFDAYIQPRFSLNVPLDDLPFEPYVGGKPSPNMQYPQSINGLNLSAVAMGRNLWIPTYYVSALNSKLTKEGNSFTFTPSGTSAYVGFYTNVFPLEYGKTYTVSADCTCSVSTTWSFGKEKQNPTTATSLANETIHLTHTFTRNEDTNKAIIFYCVKNGGFPSDAVMNVKNIQIELNNKATRYEPYRTPQEFAITARGIKVSKGGNYTDSNGQMWYCDTVDLAKGIYTQRIKRETVRLSKNEPYPTGYGYRWTKANFNDVAIVQNDLADPILCDKLVFNSLAGTGTYVHGEGDGLRMSSSYKTIVAEFKDDVNTYVDVECEYMIQPVELPISTAFKTLFPTTIITSNTDRIEATAKVVDESN